MLYFKDLNKSCPKELFSLPHIDKAIDALAGNEILSFLDAYSEYNKIRLHLEDLKKTSFIMDYVTYCYNVIPFSLKSIRATYQRLVNKMFEK